MQFGSAKDWGRGGRQEGDGKKPPDQYPRPGGPSRPSYSPNFVRGTSRRFAPGGERRSPRASPLTWTTANTWDTTKEYQRQLNYQATYSSPTSHSSSFDSRPRGSPLDWNPENPNENSSVSKRFTDPGEDVVQDLPRPSWSSPSTFTRRASIEKFDYQHSATQPMAVPMTDNPSLDDLGSPGLGQSPSPCDSPLADSINVLELANKISSLGPLIRDPRLLTRILKITKSEDPLTSPKRDEPNFGSLSSVPNPMELHWAVPSEKIETTDQMSRQNKLSEYSQKYKIVKKSNPVPAASPSSASAVSDGKETKEGEGTVVGCTTRAASANTTGDSATVSLPAADKEGKTKESLPATKDVSSVPPFASKAQTFVKDSFLKLKQEGRAKMSTSTPSNKRDSKQNQALLKMVAGSKEDSSHRQMASSPMGKLPGIKNILNSVMKTSISQVLRKKMDSSKGLRSSEKELKESPANVKGDLDPEATPKDRAEAGQDTVKVNKELGHRSSKESHSNDPEGTPRDNLRGNRARKGQTLSGSDLRTSGSQQASVVTRKQASANATSNRNKKKMKKRHFRGGTYNLYLTKKNKKKKARADDELSIEGTETTGSLVDSEEDDTSNLSEDFLTTSETSVHEDEITPPKQAVSGERLEPTSPDCDEVKTKLSFRQKSSESVASGKPVEEVPTKASEKETPNSDSLKDSEREEINRLGKDVKVELNDAMEETGLDKNDPTDSKKSETEETSQVTNSETSLGVSPSPVIKTEPLDEMDDTLPQGTEEEAAAGTNVKAPSETKSDLEEPLSPAQSETVGSSAESHSLSDGELNKENTTPFVTPKSANSIASCVKTRQRIKRKHSVVDIDGNTCNSDSSSVNGSESPFKKPKKVQPSGLCHFVPPVPNHPVTNLAKLASSGYPKIDVLYDHKRLPQSACTCQAKPLEARNEDTTDAKIYCQAVDSIDEKLIGCCNIVGAPQLVRPSMKIPFTAMCEVHLWRLKHHHCCPVCGVFCSQGSFMQCTSSFKSKSQVHLFHRCCLVVNDGQGTEHCPHCTCCDSLKAIQLELNMPVAPTFYLSQKPLFSEPRAKMTITRLMKDVKSEIDDVASVKFVIPDTEIVLSSAGLPAGPKREKLDELLLDLAEKDLSSLKFTVEEFLQAARDGDVENVLHMLALGLDPNLKQEQQSKEGPLHGAAANDHLVIVHLLVQAGASVDRLDGHLYTPLMLAVENGQTQTAQYLVKIGAQLSPKGEDGMTCLHLAARAGSAAICKMLLDTGKIIPNVQDDGGWTPIVWAAEHSHLDIVRLLVERGADPNMRDNEQNVALHWSAFSGNVDISHLFLELGSDLTATNEHGDTPLHIAARQNKYACVVLFLARGANIEAVNKENELPITCCADPDSQTYMALMMNRELKKFARNRVMKAERVIHSDITKGKEQNSIQCVNGIDEESVPTDYMYVVENCETSPVNIDRTITSLQSCRCEDDCTSPSCTCATLSFKCWFDNDGRLLPEFNLPDPPMIFECNRACLCWKNCNNRALQHGILCRLQLFRTHNKGWGVRTLKDIPKGTFICEYVGEIITDGEADQREDDSYLFDLDNRQDSETYCLDARYYGNVSRFVNHQCEPNLVPVKVFVDHQDLSFPRIAFFSSRDIYANEELGFDYGEKFWVIKYKSFTCDCGSPNCKYSTHTIHPTLENYYRRLKEADVEENLDLEGQAEAPAS